MSLTGKTFGKLTVVERNGSRHGKTLWRCKCECGKEHDVVGVSLTNGHTKSCGCTRKLEGQQFGKLTVLRREGTQSSKAKWFCQCACGNTTVVIGGNLVSGNTKSCGCEHAKHGHCSIAKGITPTYSIWASMKARCLSTSARDYAAYGGRGITVCERWMQFENFLADMGECPKGLTLDRRDNNKGYSPDNCRWATYTTQNNNKRNNRLVLFNGGLMTLAQFSEVTGCNESTVRYRLANGWTPEQIVATPQQGV